MKGLILNRNKYIIERSKYDFIVGTISIIAGILAVSGLVAFANTNSTRSRVGTGKSATYASAQYDYADAQPNSGTADEDSKNDSAPDIIKKDIPETYLVTRIVDGDTIYVEGIDTRIRLIGVDTPETVKDNTPVQCYGPEASNYLKNLILGKYVGLERDAASGDVDIYGRPLRYVFLNGENVNQKIILGGYGKEASYGNEYRYRSEFVESEEYAASHDIGLWSPLTCNGNQ